MANARKHVIFIFITLFYLGLASCAPESKKQIPDNFELNFQFQAQTGGGQNLAGLSIQSLSLEDQISISESSAKSKGLLEIQIGSRCISNNKKSLSYRKTFKNRYSIHSFEIFHPDLIYSIYKNQWTCKIDLLAVNQNGSTHLIEVGPVEVKDSEKAHKVQIRKQYSYEIHQPHFELYKNDFSKYIIDSEIPSHGTIKARCQTVTLSQDIILNQPFSFSKLQISQLAKGFSYPQQMPIQTCRLFFWKQNRILGYSNFFKINWGNFKIKLKSKKLNNIHLPNSNSQIIRIGQFKIENSNPFAVIVKVPSQLKGIVTVMTVLGGQRRENWKSDLIFKSSQLDKLHAYKLDPGTSIQIKVFVQKIHNCRKNGNRKIIGNRYHLPKASQHVLVFSPKAPAQKQFVELSKAKKTWVLSQEIKTIPDWRNTIVNHTGCE